MKLKMIFLFGYFIMTFNFLFSSDNKFITGNVLTDFRIHCSEQGNINAGLYSNFSQRKYSPLISGILSIVVPGTGQIYLKSYFKALLFLAIEGTTIYLNYHYSRKGDDQTLFFQNFADENWSVVRYAQWLNEWADKLGGSASISINPDESLKPWKRVNWDQINSAERTIKEFSHTLYPYGHQQYYEMIGKYPQYSQGWNDSKFSRGEYSIAGEYYFDTKGNFIRYSQMRGEANDYYNIADKALIVTITNHLISFVDAILTTNNLNSKVKANTSLEKVGIGYFSDLVPTLNVKFNL